MRDRPEMPEMVDWIPVVFVTFKVLVLGIGMFFAVKWHYDKGRNDQEKRAFLFAAAKVAAVFLLSLLVVGLFTFFLVRTLGLDMTFP